MEAIQVQQVNQHYLVIGMGVSGYATIRYLLASGYDVTACDTRENAPYAKTIQEQYPQVPQISGIPYALFSEFDQVVASPGVKIEAGYDVIGDIELFAQHANAPIIAITGSNGKSTVTMLVDRLLQAGGYHSLVGGNIGTPVLDLLDKSKPDFYVLELSSFQLETTSSLKAKSACVLNLSADHLDRYENESQYLAAKMRIYRGAHAQVINRQQADIYTQLAQKQLQQSFSFGLDQGKTNRDFGLIVQDGETYFAKGDETLLPVTNLHLAGRHNQLNMLAACALVSAAGIPVTREMLLSACQYVGLEHRCELVARHHGVVWINDSKGTNVGATCAALAGFNTPVILIAGGVGKEADFSPLTQAMRDKVTQLIVFGEDAKEIAATAPENTVVWHVHDLAQAVDKANTLSESGATVLFSPASASFDMFRNFEHRGHIFKDLVNALVVNSGVAR